MLKVNDNDLENISINFEMSPQERAIMASAVHQEWFAILQKLMEEEIRKLTSYLLASDPADEKSIVARFRVCKGAAMFYKGMIQRLEHELQLQKFVASGVGTIANPEEQPSVIDNLGGEQPYEY